MANLFSKKQTPEINLLPERDFAGTITGRILSWIISTFRVIVIATEILVMIAFLSRFWLDAQNTDLNEEIDQKKAILSASLDFEHQFKDTQKRIEIYKVMNNQRGNVSYITSVSQQLPPDVSLTSITKLGQELEIQGVTASEQSAQQLVVNLGSANSFKNVELVGITSNELNPGLLTFTIKVTTQGGQPQ